MENPLLTTKLYFPILRLDVVPRVRLIERLNTSLWQPEGFIRKLTLISAPAGFGKTTLVSEWLSNSRFPLTSAGKNQDDHLRSDKTDTVAWLSLDESDNDPARFLAYLIAAIRTLQPEFGQRTESMLQLAQQPPPNVILTSLVNEFSHISGFIILALDDYHFIHSVLIHQQLTFILDHQPTNMHLVILTREDPLLPVSRLRARGQLLELRQDDLRFSQTEIADFLQRGTNLPFKMEDVASLERHTEGWAAGLQLTMLSMRGREDISAFIHDFSASDQFMLDYLIEEVFEHQPADVQDFLMQTSVLKRLSHSLCNA